MPPAFPSDLDESPDWLESLNDECFERFGTSTDEFKSIRKKEEESGTRVGLDDGFRTVYRKKKGRVQGDSEMDTMAPAASLGVKMATRDEKAAARVRPRVPFHIPSIPRPQKEFNILVNNSNRLFEHVRLEKSEDGSRFVHPLEKLSVLDFVDRDVSEVDPVKPLPIEMSPVKLVEGLNGLKELAAKLQDVKEFAVDLEHNQYRSFQGLTCLMQISTRTEDFIIDTLKLHVHVGPHLREVFKDPTKRKVMHGADRDIFWLQRDFSIYVCNLFDTGQASRVLKLERNSLEYLLHHFCGFNANKEYQNADWRLRPLPAEMLKYAREDTHYLLYIYDLMRSRLLSESSSENDLLSEVYKQSYEICRQLYEKELLTDTSYLRIYGLPEADFNSRQLAIVYGLCKWRDKVAREDDESTGYILPNKALLEIARQMPDSCGKLRRLVRSKHPYIERNLNRVITIIKNSVEKFSDFESISEELKKGRIEISSLESTEVGYNSESMSAMKDSTNSTISRNEDLNGVSEVNTMQSGEHAIASMDDNVKPAELFSGQTASVSSCHEVEKLRPMPMSENMCSFLLSDAAAVSEKRMDDETIEPLRSAKKAIASIQILKKPTGAFAALLGHSSSKKKFNPDSGCILELNKNVIKVEQIRSSVTLPFHFFSGRENTSQPRLEETIEHPPGETANQCSGQPAEMAKLEDMIPLKNEAAKLEDFIFLENEADHSQLSGESPVADDGPRHREWFSPHPQNGSSSVAFGSESDAEECPMSLTDLSSSFQNCFQSINERRGCKQNQKPNQEAENYIQLKPFDYAVARKTTKFGEGAEVDNGVGALPNSREKRKGPSLGRGAHGEGRADGGFQQPRRRQAFPPSGNRSATYQ